MFTSIDILKRLVHTKGQPKGYKGRGRYNRWRRTVFKMKKVKRPPLFKLSDFKTTVKITNDEGRFRWSIPYDEGTR